MKRLSQDYFIKKCNNIHDNFYDYSKTSYKIRSRKVIIGCPKHGFFEQQAYRHLMGQGCLKCFNDSRGKIFSLTQQQFLRKRNNKHNNFYDYSKRIYTGHRNNIIIGCPIHGFWRQRANNHLNGQGCYKCGKDRLKLTQQQFLQRSRQIHNNKYDYSKAIYKWSRSKVCIICPVHGQFYQTSRSHIKGVGCPKCKNSKGQNKIYWYLKNNNILCIKDKTFPDCKYKKELKFDFYLPDNNILIQYDGVQHFNLISFGVKNNEESIRNFEMRKLRDNIKDNYRKNKNIKLIRIPYTKFKQINKILDRQVI